MDYQTQLKVQAFLDGELSAAESRQIADLLAGDALAQELRAELAMTKSAVSGNELPMSLPESGDFFWSKISNEINRLEKPVMTGRAESSGARRWLRWLLPVTGVAALALVMSVSFRDIAPTIDETENTLEEGSVVSFRSQAEKMSVVWVQTDGSSPFTSSESDGNNERNDND